MKKHIHTWNKYNEQCKLCCSTCDMTFNEYLLESVSRGK